MCSVAPAPLTESAVLTALRDCYHPQLHANLVDLGLVQSIRIALDSTAPGSGILGIPPRYELRIDLRRIPAGKAEDGLGNTLEEALDIQLTALVQNRLAGFPSISRTDVRVLHNSAWTPDLISPQIRERILRAIASKHRSHDLVQIQTAPQKRH